MSLPVDAIRVDLLCALEQGPVVVTAPTGTGKSTQIPRWMRGRVLMVQPRRVACRAVAGRLADLEGIRVGERIGYRVRDDDCSSTNTEILLVTPGVILANSELLNQYDLVILDEFHERRLDTDLILALLLRNKARFITMSATMDGQRVAAHVRGVHLKVEARSYSVEQRYESSGDELPDIRGIEGRVVRALAALAPLSGDALVFLPGKAEIVSVHEALQEAGHKAIALHGGLSLAHQASVLRASTESRVIVTTNVAETSVTIPGVRVVIDSGLVRRTAYHSGRSYLSLANIALDSADQRAGRAGRTAPGVCVRLWGARAHLNQLTPPEVYRGSLVSLLMTTASLGLCPEELSFLDAPKADALQDARRRLLELGALEGASVSDASEIRDVLTERGRALHALPLDPWSSRILVEASTIGALSEAIDLVAALEQAQAHLFVALVEEQQIGVSGCDAAMLVTVMRRGKAASGASARLLREARSTARRLRRAFRLEEGAEHSLSTGMTEEERERLIRCILRADPGCAYVARRRKALLVFAGGGSELILGRQSRVNRWVELSEKGGKPVEAIVVLASRAFSSGRQRRLMATFASHVPLKWLAEAGLGELRVARTGFRSGPASQRSLVSTVERTFSGKVITSYEEEPKGQLARDAIVQLFLAGRVHPSSLKVTRRHLARRALAAQLGRSTDAGFFAGFAEPPALESWLSSQLEQWGVESGDDLHLLSKEDFLFKDVPPELSTLLDDRFPSEVDVGDCLYEVSYDLKRRQVTLSIQRGSREKPPPASYLPRFSGFSVFVEAGGSFHPLKR